MVDDILAENAVPAPEGTIFDRLDAHKIPWRNYYSSFPPTSYVFPGEAIEGHASLVKIEQFSPTPTTRNLPAMTGRDAAADLSDVLSLDQPPFAQPPRWPSRSSALPSSLAKRTVLGKYRPRDR